MPIAWRRYRKGVRRERRRPQLIEKNKGYYESCY
jgi:hypothetical protein